MCGVTGGRSYRRMVQGTWQNLPPQHRYRIRRTNVSSIQLCLPTLHQHRTQVLINKSLQVNFNPFTTDVLAHNYLKYATHFNTLSSKAHNCNWICSNWQTSSSLVHLSPKWVAVDSLLALNWNKLVNTNDMETEIPFQLDAISVKYHLDSKLKCIKI